MAISVRIPESVAGAARGLELSLDPAPTDLGALIDALERLRPGLREVLDSSAVNAAVNGEVILHGRDRTTLADGDQVEFLVMFAGG